MEDTKSLLEIIDDILLSAIVREVSLLRIAHNPATHELQIWEKIGTGPFEVREAMSERLVAPVVARLKIMARMSISDHHSVQQGIYDFAFGTEFSIAIKKIGIICLPTTSNGGYGEEIVVVLNSPKNN